MKLILRRLSAFVGAPFRSYLSGCGRCWRKWRRSDTFIDRLLYAPSHSTQFNERSGCFPLCEPCWKELGSPAARLPYYETLIDLWLDQSRGANERDQIRANAHEIRAAVAAGK